MLLSEFQKDKGVDRYFRTPLNLRYSLLANYIQLVLEGDWVGSLTKIPRDFSLTPEISQYFEELAADATPRFGDIYIILSPKRYRYGIFINSKLVLEQTSPLSPTQTRHEDDIVTEMAAQRARGYTTRILRPLNEKNIFPNDLQKYTKLDKPHATVKYDSNLAKHVVTAPENFATYTDPTWADPNTSPRDEEALAKTGVYRPLYLHVLDKTFTSTKAIQGTHANGKTTWQLDKFENPYYIALTHDALPADFDVETIKWLHGEKNTFTEPTDFIGNPDDLQTTPLMKITGRGTAETVRIVNESEVDDTQPALLIRHEGRGAVSNNDAVEIVHNAQTLNSVALQITSNSSVDTTVGITGRNLNTSDQGARAVLKVTHQKMDTNLSDFNTDPDSKLRDNNVAVMNLDPATGSGASQTEAMGLMINPSGAGTLGALMTIRNNGNTIRAVDVVANGYMGINRVNPESHLHLGGSFGSSVKTIFTDYTLGETDYVIFAFASDGPITLTLPPAGVGSGRTYIIIKSGNNIHPVTIVPDDTVNPDPDGDPNVTFVDQIENGTNMVLDRLFDTAYLISDGAYDWLPLRVDSAEQVTEVFGRIGDVEAVAGDYNASQVDFDPSTSDLTSTDVQGAIEQLEAEIESNDVDISGIAVNAANIATNTSDITTKAAASAVSNVDNTSDADKPVSTAQQAELDKKLNIFDDLSTFISSALPGAGSAMSYLGMSTFSTVGTMSHPNPNTTNFVGSRRKSLLTSAATADSTAEARFTSRHLFRSDNANFGGFKTRFVFSVENSVATQQTAVGLYYDVVATATNKTPSDIVDCLLLGNDNGDSNMQIIHNSGGGTATKIDLGANFPANNTDAVYSVEFEAVANTTEVTYKVTRLDTGDEATGTITANMPAQTRLLAPHFYANNGGTASAVAIAIHEYKAITINK